jgi:hypothetical protein
MKRLATSELDNLQPQYDFAAKTLSPPLQTAPNGQGRHNDAIVSSTREDGSKLYVPGGHGTHKAVNPLDAVIKLVWGTNMQAGTHAV